MWPADTYGSRLPEVMQMSSQPREAYPCTAKKNEVPLGEDMSSTRKEDSDALPTLHLEPALGLRSTDCKWLVPSEKNPEIPLKNKQ